MSNFNERHPPMGSERDIECQATSTTSVIEKDISFSSSSSEELDELALRVKALLAESDDEQIPEFSRKESQASPLPSETGTEEYVPSLSKYKDTSSLSVSCIASSKCLEWDNTADIGCVKDTIDESVSQRKSRKEPEGFTLTHEISYGSSSKYNKRAKQPMSAKDTDICERGYTSQVSQTPNLNEKSDISDNYFIKKDFISRDKSGTEANLEYTNTKLSSTSTSRVNLGNEPKVIIHSDLSVRPKISVIKPERENSSLKDSQTKTIFLKHVDPETPKKGVSFSSSQMYEGNMKILGFMNPSEDATPLKSFEHPSYQPISDLPEECQKYILSAPIYIDSEILDSNEYSRFPSDNPISSSEVLSHIRWYPIPSYKSSQDIKNAATQTSLKHSKEVGSSSYMERNKNFDDSPDTTQHLHMAETVDLSTVNLCSMLSDWQAGVDINLTSAYRAHSDCPNTSSDMADEAGSSQEFIPSQRLFQLREDVVENPDIIRTLHRKSIDSIDSDESLHLPLRELNFECSSDDNNRIKQDVQTIKEKEPSAVRYHFHDDQYIIPETSIQQEFTIDLSQKVFKDATTQVNNCNCLNEFKNMFKHALDKVVEEQVHPSYTVPKKKLENTRQIEKVSSHSEKFDVVFLGDDPHMVVITENSPLHFNNFFSSTLRRRQNRKHITRLPKGERPSTDEEVRFMEDQKKILKRLYRNHAKKFSKKLSNMAVHGKVNYAHHERVLKKLPSYL